MSSRLVACGLVAGFGPLGSHMIVPVLAHIAQTYGIGLATVQLGISAYLICLAIGQFVVGALLDRFGFRVVLVGGMTLLAVGCMIVATAPTFGVFLFGRGIQGLCGSTGMVAALALIGRDRSPRAAHYSGYLLAWLSGATMLAPVLGGVIGEWGGWRAIFEAGAALALVAAVGCALIFRRASPKDAVADPVRQKPRPPFVASATFVVHTAEISLASGAFYFFIGILPYASTQMFDFTASRTGLWLLVVSAGLPIGALGGGLVRRWSVPRIGAAAGAAGMTIATAIPPLFLAVSGGLWPAMLFVPIMLMAGAQTLLLSRAQVGAVSTAPERSGTAAGICGSLQFASGAMFAFAGGWIIEGATSYLPALLALCALCALNFCTAGLHLVAARVS